MRHCLVTGGAGFIGSHLVEALLARGDRVSVVDDESTGSVRNLAAVWDHPRLSYTKGTVADESLVARLVADADEVYHLAAAVGVQLIAQSPIRTIETNIYTTELLLRQLGQLIDAGKNGEVLPGQHERGLRQESQAAVDRRGRHRLGLDHPSAMVLRGQQGDRRVSGAGLLARAAAAGGGGAGCSTWSDRGRRGPTAWCCRGWSTPRWPAARWWSTTTGGKSGVSPTFPTWCG